MPDASGSQLDAGERVITDALNEGLPPRQIAREVWTVMSGIKRRVGRPVLREDDQKAALAMLRDGASVAEVKRLYGFGQSTIYKLRRQLRNSR